MGNFLCQFSVSLSIQADSQQNSKEKLRKKEAHGFHFYRGYWMNYTETEEYIYVQLTFIYI